MGTILAIISTHAPAGGATQSRLPSPCWCRYFYSRPCGRGDSACIDGTKKVKAFLLTPLREGRLEKNEIVRGGIKFLLTPLREGRLDFLK